MKTQRYLPEGYALSSDIPLPYAAIEQHMHCGTILEGRVKRCDQHHNLHVSFAGYEGVIPREEAISPSISGADKEIAVLSRVGHTVSFVITAASIDGGGRASFLLSRKKAQERCLSHLLSNCPPGTVCRGKITHLESFGAFVDIGCGITALLPLEYISVARIQHSHDRFQEGQNILCTIKQIDVMQNRFTLSHRELLGTWLENAALFAPGETVTGVVRGIKDYGIFVELTPNLSGLADLRSDIQENDSVSVYIKSIRPDQMKIKLQILQKLPFPLQQDPLDYYITDGSISQWHYAPPGCEKDFGSVTFS